MSIFTYCFVDVLGSAEKIVVDTALHKKFYYYYCNERFCYYTPTKTLWEITGRTVRMLGDCQYCMRFQSCIRV